MIYFIRTTFSIYILLPFLANNRYLFSRVVIPSDCTTSQFSSECTMTFNVPGLVVMVLFYLMVLGTGIWASMKSKQMKDSSQADQTEVTLLGNRGISLLVGVFTTTGECRTTLIVT